jgi:LuxR family maltose regulon positive regulatory protein
MGLDLSEGDIEILEAQTEGWVAGLQLAALSMQGHEDIPGFIKSFAGHDRYILDYLIEEVLQRQTEYIRNFLLQTSVLERLNGSLCNALTDREDGRRILDTLDRGNLFIISLDDNRHWYRYHHLFAAVLRKRLSDDQPELVPSLHRRASLWYEKNGLPGDAILHALSARDYDRAASLLELEWPSMDRNYQVATWHSWAKVLPEEFFRDRPVLNAAFAWSLMDSGDLEAAEARLKDVERLITSEKTSDDHSKTFSARMVVADKEQLRSLPGSVATAYAYLAQARGDLSGTVAHASRALELYPGNDIIRRGTPTILLGLASWSNGDLNQAYQSFNEAMVSFRMAGNMLFTISGSFLLADIRMTQGHLREAENIYQQSLNLAKEQGESMKRGTIDLHLGLSMIRCEQGDMESAEQHIKRAAEILDHTGFWRYRLSLAQAKIEESRRDFNSALKLFDRAESLYIQTPLPDLRPVSASKARVWIKQGRLKEALDWVKERNLSVNDELKFLHEFEHITLVRILITHFRTRRDEKIIKQSIGLLERLLKAAEQGERKGSMIEILVLQAMAHEAQGNISEALTQLEHALTLAEPEGYFRIFADEDAPLRFLLTKLNSSGILPDYSARILMKLKNAKPG